MSAVVREIVVTIEVRDDGHCMVSTTGNPHGDWLRRGARTAHIRKALDVLDAATDSQDDAPLASVIR